LRAELIVIATNEELRNSAAAGQKSVAVIPSRSAYGKSQGRQATHARIAAAGTQTNVRPKRKSRKDHWQSVRCDQPVHRRAHIVDLAVTLVVQALAQACAAKVEAQNRQAKA